MKGSLSTQLKMAIFGASESDHIFGTRQSAAAPRERRAKQYDAIERRVRAHAQALAQRTAERLADDDSPDTDDAGLSTVPPETTDPIEPESVALENDTAQGDASVATSDASDLASRIPEV